jgi:hypothetical protein
VINTGNPQNVTDLLQAASEADDFELDKVGSDITVSLSLPLHATSRSTKLLPPLAKEVAYYKHELRERASLLGNLGPRGYEDDGR